ncbi:MAG: GntR family transcriptional regulator [Rouxiella badensis]|jgi:DNA-binding GntR family transcriptional regulator|uniref:GntR family transcriptional regulator n=1 Tax=Rouxiella badensis TaxID=1646377 RepID=A0A1X0WIR4_9GAMM|nr:GntR family transcriptional regulator [Rouxiella badensis]MCC3720098.1 GntR family transcriptional regulator [Rouxiella badensis]MCC3729761.1 GntR family transcriptional regulator [Rouxiella badensis]MCC3738291.1 GntR family transcriptional regulator [Rouxiella badensis]ORJ26669.1 GntR family transcriptional regulator [Rouxiella badensis]WAT04002.1 GntR family transcriptional regulator [Rouxiella badensis]
MQTKLDSTADLVAASLRKMINSGELAEGARLVERDLASQFDVSRIPLREAIQQLVREGIVETQRNRGAVVKTLTAEDVNEIYSLRVLVEGDAIYQSVANMDAEVLARAELTHRLLEKATTPQKQGELNREFHQILYRGCRNARQLRLIAELCAQIERYERLQLRLLEDTPAFQHEHNAILQACKNGDPALAREATVRHIESAKLIVLGILADRQD